MSDLKTQLIKHKANRILKYYEREGIRFNTALFDDENSVREAEKSLLFIKYRGLEFSEEFAQTVIDYDNILDYHNMLIRRLAEESVSQEGFLMFTREREVDEKEVEETQSYVALTKTVLNTFLKKEDTPEFRNDVNKLNGIFASDLNVVAEGDYGVVYCYKLNSHPQFQPENEKFLKDFTQQLKDKEQEKAHQQQELER